MSWIRILPLGPLLGLVAPAALAAAELPTAPLRPLPLEWCLERAAEANPGIAADAASARAARERIGFAGALDDPRFLYQASNLPVGDLDFGSTPLSGHQLGISQKIPFPGLLGNREESARAGASAADWKLADRRLRVEARVEAVWAELGFTQRALVITDRNLDLLRQLTRIAETKYAVGSGLQQDVLRAQVELTRLLDQKLTREAAIQRIEATLADLLDLAPRVEIPETTPIADEAPLPSLDVLLSRLEERSPILHSLEARVEEALRLQRVAELEGYPDFDLGLGYRIRKTVAGDRVEGDDFLSAGVTIRLPINRTKWRSRMAEREALTRKAQSEYRKARSALRGRVRMRFADLRRAASEVELLRDGLVPQARQSLGSNHSGYEVDKVSFLSLIDSQVALIEAELRLERAWADRRQAFAALEAEAGEELR